MSEVYQHRLRGSGNTSGVPNMRKHSCVRENSPLLRTNVRGIHFHSGSPMCLKGTGVEKRAETTALECQPPECGTQN